MAGRMFAVWWGKMSPYYTKAYQEMWAGIGIMTYLYYKVSYGGEFKTFCFVLQYMLKMQLFSIIQIVCNVIYLMYFY